MSYCQECGYELKQGAKFCSGCGYNVGETEDDTQRQQEWAGKIIKCPSCGEDIPSFTGICPACGHEFREVKANMTVKELAYKLEQIEKTRTVSKNARRGVISKADEQKINLISTFPIPNTKEDLFEFLILAESNIDYNLIEGWNVSNNDANYKISNAWESKYEQAYQKAMISFGQSLELKKIQAIHKKKSINENKRKRRKIWSTIGLILVVGVVFIMGFGGLFGITSDEQKIEDENKRLEAIVDEVYDAIEEGDYVLARAKVASLTFLGPNTPEADKISEKWDKTREELLVIIEQAEKDSNKQELTDND